jgi:hypothetical protein
MTTTTTTRTTTTTMTLHCSASSTTLICHYHREKVQPEFMKQTIPLCMDQYNKLFTSCRVAELPIDALRRFASQRYVVVISNGHLFKMQVIDADDTPLTPEHITRYTC